MALPFPPAEEIPAMYARLQKMTSTQKLQQLMQYVGRNRITGNTWPSSRSVFMKSVWTNNDIEGWHLGLNHRASGKSQLPLYLLIRLLHHEARRTSLQIRLVCEEKLRRIQKKGSETIKPRSSTSGMSSTLVPVVQENYWRRAPTSTTQYLHKTAFLAATAPCFRHFGRFQVAKNGSFRSHLMCESHDQRKRTLVI